MGQSFLETRSIGEATRRDYQRRLVDFVEWCRRHHFDWASDEQLDSILVAWMDEMFFKGLAVDVASRLLAALKHFLAYYSRAGA
eukprot:549889-Karenia_brevis.AAC.1